LKVSDLFEGDEVVGRAGEDQYVPRDLVCDRSQSVFRECLNDLFDCVDAKCPPSVVECPYHSGT
jgi:hypothetical protein